MSSSSIFPIILNSRNVVPGDNSTYIYKFPSGSVKLNKASIALSQINMYNSFDNINVSLYNNNKFSIIFPNATSNTATYEITIPDGHYEITDLNSYLQSFFISQGMYHVVNTTGQFRYYFTIVANPQTYQIQLISYELPTSLPSGCSEGTIPFSYPTTAGQKPSLIIPSNNNFGQLIGFTPGTYQTAVSNITPQISPISSILVRCSLCKNSLSNPDDVLYSFSIGSAAYGSMMSIQPSTHEFAKIQDGFYSDLTIKFVDNLFNRINIKDTNLLIYLIIKIES